MLGELFEFPPHNVLVENPGVLAIFLCTSQTMVLVCQHIIVQSTNFTMHSLLVYSVSDASVKRCGSCVLFQISWLRKEENNMNILSHDSILFTTDIRGYR